MNKLQESGASAGLRHLSNAREIMSKKPGALDEDELVRFQDLLELLLNADSIEQGLDLVRSQYNEMTGSDLIIRIPVMEDPPCGVTMLPVSEGCAYIPYLKVNPDGEPEYDLDKIMLIEDVDQYALQKIFQSVVLSLQKSNRT